MCRAASTESFIAASDFDDVVSKVTIAVTAAHLRDITSVGAWDKIVMKYRKNAVEVVVFGLNEANACRAKVCSSFAKTTRMSATMMDRFALHDKQGAEAAEIPSHGHAGNVCSACLRDRGKEL